MGTAELEVQRQGGLRQGGQRQDGLLVSYLCLLNVFVGAIVLCHARTFLRKLVHGHPDNHDNHFTNSLGYNFKDMAYIQANIHIFLQETVNKK